MGVGGDKQTEPPVVSQTISVMGNATAPVSPLTTIVPVAPTFEVPMAKSWVVLELAMRTTPSPLIVDIRAIVSGTGEVSATMKRVLTPEVCGASTTLAQTNRIARLVSPMTPVGEKPKT